MEELHSESNRGRKNMMKFRKLLKVLLVNFLVLLFVLIVCEIVLHSNKKVMEQRPNVLREQSIEYAPSIFARQVFPQKEQKTVDMYWLGDDGNPSRYINALGYRGKPFNIQKNPDTVRVIVYGGSSVFDLAVPEGKDWPHRVEQYLHQQGFVQTEVINAGIPGHAAFDDFGRFFAEGHQFNPDIVILYTSWNDIKNFNSDKFLLREFQPYTPESNPLLYAQNSVDQFLIEHSLVYVVFRQSYLNAKLKVGLEGASRKTEGTYQIHPRALKQFQLTLELFVDGARNIGAVPILMTEGRLIGPHNEKDEPDRLRFVKNYMPFDYSFSAYQTADEIIKKVAAEKKADLIDTASLLVETDRDIFFDHVHLTDYGSQVISKIVGDKIIAILGKGESSESGNQHE
jgi:lysophospholipase L1-like esterase